MRFVHIHSKEVSTLAEIQTEFLRLRREDEDFARDYARHELHVYLKERYRLVDAREKKFKPFVSAYNELREQMVAYIRYKGIGNLNNLFNLTADELLDRVKEIDEANATSRN